MLYNDNKLVDRAHLLGDYQGDYEENRSNSYMIMAYTVLTSAGFAF
jgi:hypothetical protein